jgi:hypothetical protein
MVTVTAATAEPPAARAERSKEADRDQDAEVLELEGPVRPHHYLREAT